MKGPKPRPLADRFWPKVRRGDGCWLWTGYRQPSGHGRIGLDGHRVVQAHRVAWELAHGPIPDGMSVCHRCDNPPCVNPAHLFLGTQADNVADSVAKGRHVAKTNHPNARLTHAQVRDIRRLRSSGVSGQDVAALYGIGESTVSQIHHRRLWPHVAEEVTA